MSRSQSLSGKHIWMMSVVFISGLGFAYKFMEFAKTWVRGELLGFAVVPLMIYVLVSSGFACLLLWAVLGGQFRDSEKCKYRMLERELHADDPVPLPFDAEALTPGARNVGRCVALASVAVLGYLLYLTLTPPTDVPTYRPVEVASLEVSE